MKLEPPLERRVQLDAGRSVLRLQRGAQLSVDGVLAEIDGERGVCGARDYGVRTPSIGVF